MISAPEVKFYWETKNENGILWREMNLPMLGLNVSYAIRGSELILTNNADFIREIIANQNTQRNEKPDSPLTELTVLNLNQRENAYDRIFDSLAQKKAADEFFTDNISSLLDSTSAIQKIEVRKSYSQDSLNEEVTINLKK